MDAADAIRNTLVVGDMVTRAYLDDLTDEEMMMRPHSAATISNGSWVISSRQNIT